MKIDNTETFTFYNPNPAFKRMKNGKVPNWYRGDCLIRSICAATGLDWEYVYKKSFESAIKVYDMPNYDTGAAQVFKDFGFTRHSFGKLNPGEHRPTAGEFAKDHNGEICILVLAGHYVCAKDGKLHDVIDTSSSKVYSWWTKD